MADWPRDECQLREDTPSSDPGERSSGRSLAGMKARGRMSLHLKTGVKKAVAVGFEFQPLRRSHALVLFASLEGEAVPVIEGSPFPVTTSQDRGQ